MRSVFLKVKVAFRLMKLRLWIRRTCCDECIVGRYQHKDKWYGDVRQLLLVYQGNLSEAIKNGYDGLTNAERWTFPSALMFSLSVFTMIGFGHLVPRTEYGKIATIIYAVFGIPVYVLYFMSMGRVLASTFKWFYCKIVHCTANIRKEKTPIVGPDIKTNSTGTSFRIDQVIK